MLRGEVLYMYYFVIPFFISSSSSTSFIGRRRVMIISLPIFCSHQYNQSTGQSINGWRPSAVAITTSPPHVHLPHNNKLCCDSHPFPHAYRVLLNTCSTPVWFPFNPFPFCRTRIVPVFLFFFLSFLSSFLPSYQVHVLGSQII